MDVFTKIENGKRILDNIENFTLEGGIFNVLKEYKFKFVRDDERLSIWQLNDDFQILIFQDNNIISDIHLIVKDEMYMYTRYHNRIWWLLAPRKEIGSDADMIENMMDKVRSKWV